MESLFNRVVNLLVNNEQIPLRNRNFYTYLNTATTRINGILFPLAFEYRISRENTKRVTINLICAMYQHHIDHGVMPSKGEMCAQFPFELCSRPCNYTVAVYIVQKLIHYDINQDNL
jgi:hypothetical protein